MWEQFHQGFESPPLCFCIKSILYIGMRTPYKAIALSMGTSASEQRLKGLDKGQDLKCRLLRTSKTIPSSLFFLYSTRERWDLNPQDGVLSGFKQFARRRRSLFCLCLLAQKAKCVGLFNTNKSRQSTFFVFCKLIFINYFLFKFSISAFSSLI